jgi:phthalate 4,5-dioxygenase
MTTVTESEVLTRVGRGTPMGELMRQYWIPALMSSELVPDGSPVRLKLLGEQLIAFRDSSGRVGVMDHKCPHRCASLFFGRNEQDGLRCVYHGWKFDVQGNCVDMPNLSGLLAARIHVKAKAYRVQEQAGLILVYMGPRETAPALPGLQALGMDGEELSIWCLQRHSNYLQAMEGDIDTSHLGFLHGGMVQSDDPTFANRAPEYKVADTEVGVLYGAFREKDEQHLNWRFASFSLPFWTQPPPTPLGRDPVARAFVPMDDTHTMLFCISNKRFVLSAYDNEDKHRLLGGTPGITFNYEYLPNTADWYGRWRLASNSTNDFRIDREVQRTKSYTGIEGLEIQDVCITESMGPITDHAAEHLVPSDIMVARTRRRLLRAAIGLRDNGATPPGVDTPAAYASAWGGFTDAEKDVSFDEVYRAGTEKAPLRATDG